MSRAGVVRSCVSCNRRREDTMTGRAPAVSRTVQVQILLLAPLHPALPVPVRIQLMPQFTNPCLRLPHLSCPMCWRCGREHERSASTRLPTTTLTSCARCLGARLACAFSGSHCCAPLLFFVLAMERARVWRDSCPGCLGVLWFV